MKEHLTLVKSHGVDVTTKINMNSFCANMRSSTKTMFAKHETTGNFKLALFLVLLIFNTGCSIFNVWMAVKVHGNE